MNVGTLVRSLLRLSACCLVGVVLSALSGCGQPVEPVETVTEYVLGTACTIHIYERVKPDIVERAFTRVREIERKMSFRDEHSEIAEINRNAGIASVHISNDTFFVITKAIEYAEKTHGTFDITIGAVVELWGIGTDHARVPSRDEIERALASVDYRLIVLDPQQRTVYLPKKGMKIDLGGIAKGYAADEAVRIMQEAGVRRAILDFGGNIVVLGKKTEESPWKVGIQDPYGKRGSYLAILEESNTAVVSSGDYERFIERDGVRYHHILDTETGYPVSNGVAGCTVVSDSAMEADAFSTAVFSLGMDAGIAFLSQVATAEGLLISEEKTISLTEDLEPDFTLTNDQYTVIGPLSK